MKTSQTKKPQDTGTLILIALPIAAGVVLLLGALGGWDQENDKQLLWLLGVMCVLGGSVMGVIRAQTDRILQVLVPKSFGVEAADELRELADGIPRSLGSEDAKKILDEIKRRISP